MQSISELFGGKTVGTVKSFDFDRGFGFIKPLGRGGDVFLHSSELRRCQLEDLEPGDIVAFDVILHAKGQRATNVELVA